MPLARELLERLLESCDLTQVEAEELLGHLTDPQGSPIVAGAVLAALRSKGVVAEELRGFAAAMRRLARRPPFRPDFEPSISWALGAMRPGVSTSRQARHC